MRLGSTSQRLGWTTQAGGLRYYRVVAVPRYTPATPTGYFPLASLLEVCILRGALKRADLPVYELQAY